MIEKAVFWEQLVASEAWNRLDGGRGLLAKTCKHLNKPTSTKWDNNIYTDLHIHHYKHIRISILMKRNNRTYMGTLDTQSGA